MIQSLINKEVGKVHFLFTSLENNKEIKKYEIE